MTLVHCFAVVLFWVFCLFVFVFAGFWFCLWFFVLCLPMFCFYSCFYSFIGTELENYCLNLHFSLVCLLTLTWVWFSTKLELRSSICFYSLGTVFSFTFHFQVLSLKDKRRCHCPRFGKHGSRNSVNWLQSDCGSFVQITLLEQQSMGDFTCWAPEQKSCAKLHNAALQYSL